MKIIARYTVFWLALGLCTQAQRFSDGSFYDIELPGVSVFCKVAVNASIACDRLLGSALGGGTPPSTDKLDKVCVTDCVESLQEYRASVAKACTLKDDVVVLGDIAYNATYTADELLHSYNAICEKEVKTMDYCWVQLASINDTLTSEQECSACLLGRYQIDLSSPFGYNDRLAKKFSSLTSSCSATGYAYTSPTPIALNGTEAPTPTPASCSDSQKYRIKKGDDCKTVSLAQNVSTWALLHENNLQAYCKNFPGEGTTLCLPKQCSVYTLLEGDTCDGIVNNQPSDISVVQLQSWNPNINRLCGNLFQWAGYQICVSPPGSELDPVIIPTPTPTKCEGLWQPNSCYTAPPTDSIWPDDPGVIPLPFAPGTWTNCTVYTTYLNSTAPEYDNTCRTVALFYDVSAANLQKWNPYLGRNNAAECQIEKGFRYCVVDERSPAPTSATSSSPSSSLTTIPTSTVQEEIAENCTGFYKVADDDSCYDIAQDNGVALEDFHQWNPAIKDDCSMLLYDYDVCVGVSD